MKYKDLISFEAIESVLKLAEANNKTKAEEHVRTFVMSENLRKQLKGIVFPNLQFEKPHDNKGLFIVGTYGTGKTHLMSVISAICEHNELRPDIQGDKELGTQMDMVQGKFMVIRFALGSTLNTLRPIICEELEKGLASIGVTYKFPPQDKITNHQEAFQEMMAGFDAKYPGMGLLLVADELLEYLRMKDEQQLMIDFSFMRELGEISSSTRFRFMAGIQESLFDNPSWAHLSSQIQKVKDRFEQMRIAREDVAEVVSKRLLRKNEDQKKQIRAHLEEFIGLYGTLANRMNEFVDLYPVHPVYLEVFERIHVAERREVLKTLSQSMRDLLDKEVPEDHLELITFDSYWFRIHNDPTLLSNQDIKTVLERTKVLESKILQSFPKPQYKDAAIKIVHGLSVFRLTTPDTMAAIGLTPQELRDDLCIHLRNMPEQKADFLGQLIVVILNDIIATVSGQYISKNKDNGQYYIDVTKIVDYDQNILDRAGPLPAGDLNSAYFDALRKIVLENPEQEAYVHGFKIWAHEVLWSEKCVMRPGYIFFGAPNERSTAQPPRDFYLYFLQIRERPHFKDEKRLDEVFFELDVPKTENWKDDPFERPLRIYGAAIKLAGTQAHARQIYLKKADEAFKELGKWLENNLPSKCYVTHRGERKLLRDWNVPGPKQTIRDMVEMIASNRLAMSFGDAYPDYPCFEGLRNSPLGNDNRDDYCRAALKHIAGMGSSKHSKAVLDGLELLDGDVLAPAKSRFARPILEALGSKGPNQVVNRSELMAVSSEPYSVEYERTNKIEPELMAVVLGSLAYHGDVVISYPGEKVDAGNLGLLTRRSPTELGRFKHIERPRDMPIPAIMALCRLVGVNENLVKKKELHKDMLRATLERCSGLIDRTVKRIQWLKNVPELWGMDMVDDARAKKHQEALGKLKDFLEGIQAYDNPAKLVNFRYSEDEVSAQQSRITILDMLDRREKLFSQFQSLVSYINQAEVLMPDNHPWRTSAQDAKGELAKLLAEDDPSQESARSVERALKIARGEYVNAYIDLHKRARLGVADDKRKQQLMKDRRLEKLKRFRSLPLLDARHLERWIDRVGSLRSCFALTEKDLESKPRCPHCNFNPGQESTVLSSQIIDELEDALIDMEERWTHTVVSSLHDPTVEESIKLLEPSSQGKIAEVIECGTLSDDPSDELVQALIEVEGGLQKVEIDMEEVRQALIAAGSARKPDEVKDRFDELLSKKIKGSSTDKVRIVFTDKAN